jgi:hypothetical protein
MYMSDLNVIQWDQIDFILVIMLHKTNIIKRNTFIQSFKIL